MTSLFIISLITMIMYVRKVIYVLRFYQSDPVIYRQRAYPAVLHSKIWNSILGVAHFLTCVVFLSQGGRVCAGWYLGSKLEQFVTDPEDYSPYERNSYLIARGGWFIMATLFGLGNIVGFVACGYKAQN